MLRRSEVAVVALPVRSLSDVRGLRSLRSATRATLVAVTGPAPPAELLRAVYGLAAIDHLEEPVLPEVLHARLALHSAAHAQAIGRIRAELALHAAESRFRFLQALEEATRDEITPESVMEAAARHLGRHLGVSRCAYAHVHEDADTFVIRHDYTDGCPSSVGEYSLDLFGPRAAADMRAGRTLIVHDVIGELAPDSGAEMFLAIEVQAIVCCSLVKHGRLVAMMAVHQTTPRSWLPEEVALVQEAVERCRAHIERARSAQELRESEERFRNMADHAPVMIWVTAADGTCTYLSRSWYEFTGQDERDGPDLQWLESVHPDDRAVAEAAFVAANVQGEPFRIEYRLRHHSGEHRWAIDTAAPRYAPDGGFLGYVGSVIDISGRKRIEDALRDSEQRFRTFVTTTSAVVWTTDGNGEVHQDNPSWEAFTGQTEEAYRERGWLDAIHPDDREAVDRSWARAVRDRAIYEQGYRLRRRDGQYRDVLARAAPIVHEGSLREWVGDCTDVTDQRAAEQYRLEQDRRKDQFIAMSAHELRNPLGPIRNAMHLLGLTRDEATLRRVRSMVERQVDHLAHIVDDLLEISRVTTGRVRLRRERLELGRLVSQVTEDGRTGFEQAGISLDLVLPDTPVWVEGDRTRLTQVFDNLLANALKFTDRGGVVTVRVAATGSEAAVSVRDNGIGIDPELLQRLFEPFTQADRTLDRSLGGLGLGLAMVKGFVDLHGGRVSAASAGIGRGTEMTVALPRVAEPAALSAEPQPMSRPAAARRVLVIEDNRDAADTLQLLLELSGCEVAVAYTGPDGVDRALSWVPDVVLCDIGLPGMNGYDVARRLRAELTGAPLRLIALTGYGEEDDRRRAKEAGFDRHFTKPMDPDALQALLLADS